MTLSLLSIVSTLAVVALLLVVLREFWTWYWKQSEQVQLLKSIAVSLAALEERTRGSAPAPTLPASGFDRTIRATRAPSTVRG